jgi:dihydroflavonol-4-reductase
VFSLKANRVREVVATNARATEIVLGQAEGVVVSSRNTLLDDTPARRELGIEPVPFEDSLRDTVRWLVGSGRLKPRYAGRALTR